MLFSHVIPHILLMIYDILYDPGVINYHWISLACISLSSQLKCKNMLGFPYMK